jgi:hypothetical protein
MEAVDPSVQRSAIVFSAILIVLAIPAPILLHALARPSNGSALPPAQTACEPDQQSLQGSMLKNIRIVLVPNEASNESYMPFIRLGDFRSGLFNNFTDNPSLGQELQSLQAGQQISLGFDLNAQSEWLISSFPVKAGRFSACGTASENQDLRAFNFYSLKGPLIRPSSLTISQQYPGVTLLFRLLYGLGVILIMVLVAMNSYQFGLRTLPENLYLIAATILILQSVLVALYAQAIITIPFAEQRSTLQAKDAVPVKPTNLYILPLGVNWMNQTDLGSSPAVVYENGIPLESPNSLRQVIKDKGNGSYSVWNGALLFSPSDNTSPRTNGRKYELAWPRPIRPELQGIS